MVEYTVYLCLKDKLIPRALIDKRENDKTYNVASNTHSLLVGCSFVGSEEFLEE
jgi:hypothetical protein